MRKLFLILMTLIVSGLAVSAQTRSYQGTVVDATTSEPLIGATILPLGGGQGVATDVEGKFKLNVPANVKEIQVSYVGYKTVKVPLTQNVVVKMQTTDQTLDDVMVVAFGTTTKEAFTGSAAVVGSGELQKRTTTNVADALIGSVPGLQMRSSTGSPGSDGSINIRGISSLYSGIEPLVIVDGAPYTASLSNIPQSDIASISVLKDAASAALYGARGAAGVIIITTKRGANKEAQITVNAKWGSNSRAVQDYDVITDPAAFYEAYYAQVYNYNYYHQGMTPAAANQASNNMMLGQLMYNVYTLPKDANGNEQLLIGMDGKLNPNATLGRKIDFNGQQMWLTPDNWNDEAYHNGFRQEYNLSVNGGTDRASFYASLNYLGDEGILQPSSYDRVSGRIRADYQAKKWLKVGANVGYTHSNSVGNPSIGTGWSSNNILYFTGMIAPIYPVYARGLDAAGNPYILTDEYGNTRYDFGQDVYYSGTRPFGAPGNPIADQVLNTSKSDYNQLNATLNATVDFTSYLKLDVVSNVNWGETRSTSFGNPLTPGSASVNGNLTKATTTNIRTNNSQTLTFYKYFGDHYLNVMAGHEYYRTDGTYLAALGRGMFSPDVLELDAFADVAVNASSYKTSYNVEGWFGSAQYNFLEKYYASAMYRRDASSRFHKSHRWGNFWSFGAAWMISKENFMAQTKNWLDYLKLKVSIGQQGNDNLSTSYGFVNTYKLQPSSKEHMSPVFSNFGNPDITWETTTNFNVGLEFGFFNNRLTGNIDVYNKNTNNLLFWLTIPESTGARGYWGNVGSLRNTGVELVLSGTPIRTKDYEWNITANLSHNVTKLTKLPESKIGVNGGWYDDGYWYEVGGPMYNYMDLAYAGVNDKGQALYYYDPNLVTDGTMDTSRPGTIKSMDYVTTEAGNASRYAIGSILPKVFGGFNTTVRIKWFDISASFDYQIGGKVYDSRYAALMTPNSDLSSTNGQTYHKDWINSWSPNNTDSNLPRWQIGDTDTGMASDRFLANAGYLNFQSFVVGFTLPKLFNDIEKIRVYCMGENLCFWSARKGLDPRYSYGGNASVGAYSPMRTISGGVEVVF